MKDWIRWPGLLTFTLLTAVIAGGFYFFAGTLLKAAIEHTGTDLVGAKVELDQADFSISPLGFDLYNLQVTNPDEPMVNIVQIAHINFHMNGLELLRLKVIIDEMNVEQVRLNTKRTRSGKIAEKPADKPEPDSPGTFDFLMPDVELPAVKDILDKETLESDRLVEKARLDLDKSKQEWDKKVAELPDKATFEAYGQTLKSIKPVKTGNKLKDLQALADAINELKKVKKNIKADVAKLNSASKALRQDIDLMKSNINAVAKAPKEDIERLKQKYSPSAAGAANISRALFGETAAYWTGITLEWYEKLAPVVLKAMKSDEKEEKAVPRNKGIDVKFKEHNPLPDFLIKTSHVSLALESGNLNGKVKDITNDQETLGRPLTFRFDADKMKNIDKIKFTGNFNHIKPGKSIDKTDLSLSGYQINNFVVAKSKSFPLSLNSAVMNMQLNGELIQGVLKANLASTFKSANFAMNWKKKPAKLVKVMGDALESVNAFNVNADLNGTLKDHDLNISSDLDNVVKAAMGKQFNQKVQKFEQELRDKVEQKTKALTARLESRLDKFRKIEDDLNAKKNQAQEKVKAIDARIDAFKKEKQAELNQKKQQLNDKKKKKLDKLKDKLRDKFR